MTHQQYSVTQVTIFNRRATKPDYIILFNALICFRWGSNKVEKWVAQQGPSYKIKTMVRNKNIKQKTYMSLENNVRGNILGFISVIAYNWM